MVADRTQLLEEIQQAGFQVDDLTLYLDTHPLDKEHWMPLPKQKTSVISLCRIMPGNLNL